MSEKQSPPQASSFRLLILSPTTSDSKSIPPFVPFLEAITGSRPLGETTVFSGYTSHPPLKLRTKYYSSDVPIWCDELPPSSPDRSALQIGADSSSPSSPPPPSLSEWKSQILSSEAAEVRAVIGGIILLLPISSTPAQSIPQSSSSPSNPHIHLIQTLHELREAIEDESPGRDIASLVVFQSASPSITKKSLNESLEKLEDLALSEGHLGWDFVVWDGQVRPNVSHGGNEADSRNPLDPSDDEVEHERNEFGEKTGIQRVLEVLEGIDWTASPSFDLDDTDGAGLDLDDLNIGGDEDLGPRNILRGGMGPGTSSGLDFELQREMMELKMSMLDGDHGDDGDNKADEEGQIDELPALLERVVAIREAGAEMSKEERERFARREIARIMREMG